MSHTGVSAPEAWMVICSVAARRDWAADRFPISEFCARAGVINGIQNEACILKIEWLHLLFYQMYENLAALFANEPFQEELFMWMSIT